MNFIQKIISSILAMFGISSVLAAKKAGQVKKLKQVIKDNKQEEKKVQSAILKLEKSKEGSNRTITTLKKQLDNMKTDRKDMETVADKGDVDEAIDFLKKFSKGN
jgi:cell division protein FtsB